MNHKITPRDQAIAKVLDYSARVEADISEHETGWFYQWSAAVEKLRNMETPNQVHERNMELASDLADKVVAMAIPARWETRDDIEQNIAELETRALGIPYGREFDEEREQNRSQRDNLEARLEEFSDDGEGERYTPEAQEVFNEYYAEFMAYFEPTVTPTEGRDDA